MAVDKGPMAVDASQSADVDLDRTDRLPILDGTLFDADVEDDAVPMEYTASLPTLKADFPRPSGVDLPSLAESVRSVEERIARQSADYDSLTRSYDKAREAEAAASSRATALAAELAMLRSTLETEQARSRDTDRSLAEQIAAVETARVRSEEARREVERYQSESETLRSTLVARDAAIAQALHSLGERDAQLVSLQREHAQLVPALEARVEAGDRLAVDLQDARARTEAVAAELKAVQGTVVTLKGKLNTGDTELGSTRLELDAVKSRAESYLEQLRTREWRRGFDHNLFRELDAEIGAVQGDRGAIQSERDRLRQELTELKAQLAGRDESILKLSAAATEDGALLAKQEQDLRALERERSQLRDEIAAIEAERARLTDVLATQHESIAKLKAAATAEETLRGQHERDLQDLDGTRQSLQAQIASLESERDRLQREVVAKDGQIKETLDAGAREVQSIKTSLTHEAEQLKASLTSETQRISALLSTADEGRNALAATVEKLKAEARARDEEMSVLVAHLQEARRPVQTIEAEVKRLTDELAAKSLTLNALTDENRNLRASVERTKGALEEREFLIRRLERSESNNANVLGRIQTSIERLGAPVGAGPSAAQTVECTAEMSRIDGQHNTTYTLARRTRIGRAPGCELRVESSSVSRHHALVLLGQREAIIEDLNSTNGVIVNGRKISRQMLNDGDVVTIGEAQFRFNLTLAPRVLEAPQAE